MLSTDLVGLLALDLPLERAAGALRRLVLQRAAGSEAGPSSIDRKFDDRIEQLSKDISNQPEAAESRLARSRSADSEPASLLRALESVQSAEADIRSAGGSADTATLLARSRAVRSAAADLTGLSRDLIDRIAKTPSSPSGAAHAAKLRAPLEERLPRRAPGEMPSFRAAGPELTPGSQTARPSRI